MKAQVAPVTHRELVELAMKAGEASNAYKVAAKTVAEKVGVKPAVLKKAIATLIADKADEKKKEAFDLLSLIEQMEKGVAK